MDENCAKCSCWIYDESSVYRFMSCCLVVDPAKTKISGNESMCNFTRYLCCQKSWFFAWAVLKCYHIHSRVLWRTPTDTFNNSINRNVDFQSSTNRFTWTIRCECTLAMGMNRNQHHRRPQCAVVPSAWLPKCRSLDIFEGSILIIALKKKEKRH